MLIPTELRLGNYILVHGKPTLVTLPILERLSLGYASYMQGIELTPKILKGTNLKRHLSSDKVITHYFGYNAKKDDIIFSLQKVNERGEFFIVHNHRKITIHNFHQLQNLYFALTNAELTVNFNLINETAMPPN